MPSIPRYDDLTVAPRALPGARQEINVTGRDFNRGENIAQLGKGMQNLGGDLGDIAVKMQERENADTLFQVDAAVKGDLIKFDTEQRDKRGAAALADGGVTKLTEKFFGEMVQKHSGALKNDVQRRIFGEIISKLKTQTLDSMSKHQATEARVSLTDSTNASIVSSINRSAANAHDWSVVESERGEIRKRVAVLAEINGWDSTNADGTKNTSVRDGELGKHLTTLHHQVIQQLVAKPATAVLAKAYFDKYKEEIDGSKRAEIGKFAEEAASTSIGDGTADVIWKADMPKTREAPITLAAMEEKLRTQLTGNDAAIKIGIAGLRERVAAYKDQRTEETSADKAAVELLIMQGVTGNALKKRPEFLQLSSRNAGAAMEIVQRQELLAYTRAARGAAESNRAYTEERRAEARLNDSGTVRMWELSDPNRLVKIPRNDIINMAGDIGKENVDKLLAKQESLIKHPEKLIEARIDKQDFDKAADELGLKPFDPVKSETERRRLNTLQQAVETRIDQEQRARGNKLMTREEKMKLVKETIDDKVMTPGFFSVFDTENEVTAAMLSKDARKTAYVNVGKQRVKLADIDDDFRERAIRALRQQGVPPTEQLIADQWLKFKTQGRIRK